MAATGLGLAAVLLYEACGAAILLRKNWDRQLYIVATPLLLVADMPISDPEAPQLIGVAIYAALVFALTRQTAAAYFDSPVWPVFERLGR